MAAVAVTTGADDAAPAAVAADDITAAEPSAYSPAYLPPKLGPPLNPYEGAVASTSTNIIRTPGNFGQVAAYHKTVETPFSSSHKADVRFTNDVVPLPYQPSGPYAAPGPYPYAAPGPYPYAAPGPYPYAAGPTVAAGPYPYSSGGPFKAYGYGPATAPAAVPYGYGPIAPVPQAAAPYGYGPAAGAPVASHAVVTPHSVAHASFSGPYGSSHYSYKR